MAIGGISLANRYDLTDSGTGSRKSGVNNLVNTATIGAVTGAINAAKGTAKTTGTSTGSGRSGGTSGGTSVPSYDLQSMYDSYWSGLLGASAPYLAEYDDAYARSAQRIEDAYNASMGRVAQGYNTASGAYQKNLDSTLGILRDSYNASRGEVTTDAERSLREAYINNMMRRRDLNQTMSAMGLNGGASESTMASMANQYGNARSTIEESRNRSLAELLRTRDQNVASAQQAYNTQLADLENQRLNMENQLIANRLSALNQADQASAAARAQIAMFNLQQMNAYQSNLQNAYASMVNAAAAGGLNSPAYQQALSQFNLAQNATPVYGGLQAIGDSAMTGLTGWNTGKYSTNTRAYANELQNLVDAQKAFSFNATEAGNAYNPASVQQAQATQGTNYARYLQQLQQELAAGANPNDVRTSLYRNVQNGSVDRNDLASMLRQLGLI